MTPREKFEKALADYRACPHAGPAMSALLRVREAALALYEIARREHRELRVRGKESFPRFSTVEMEANYHKALAMAGVFDSEAVGPEKDRHTVAFRWAWTYTCRTQGFSFPEIARSMRKQSHTSLIEAMDKMLTGSGWAVDNGRAMAARFRVGLTWQAGPSRPRPTPQNGPPGGPDTANASGGIVGQGNTGPITVIHPASVP